jgi:hypothetical protein
MMCKRLSLLVVLSLGACGTPARRLSPRTVEDPMVLPRRMIKMSLGTSWARKGSRPPLASYGPTGLDYGITNRLQLTDLLSLTYAFLDDAPRPDGSPPPPLSLAVRAGVVGIGSFSDQGFFMVPVVIARIRKHLGERTYLEGTATGQSRWVERPAPTSERHDDLLAPVAARMSELSVAAGVVRQVANRWAVGLSVEAHQLQSCSLPFCAWDSRGGAVWLSPSFRPWHWLTISGELLAGIRGRSPEIEPITPIALVAVPPASVSWVTGSLGAAFLW